MSGQAQQDEMIVLKDVNKWFGEFHVLKGINLQVGRKEVVVICGPSGSGKSTLIRCINRLEEHQSGDIIVDNIPLNHNVGNIEAIRMETGMVFQQFNLFPHLTVMQNITLAPTHVRKKSKAEAESKAMELLQRVGIPEQAKKYPGQLSGGQQQRVAIARALIHNPALVLADEPTASLDTERAFQVVETFANLIHENGRAGIIVTHDLRMCQYVDRVLQMQDGKLIRTYENKDEIMELATATVH